MNTLEDRVAWALGYIKKKEKITNIQLSKILEVDKNTVQAYCHGKGTLKGSALAVIVKVYGFNGEWLMAGKGEPFPGASEIFPEVCGKPPVTPAQIDQITQYVKDHPVDPRTVNEGTYSFAQGSSVELVNVDEIMGKAYIILSANTELSQCLSVFIQQISTASKARDELQNCQKELMKTQHQIADLQKQLDEEKSIKPCDGEVKDKWF